MKNIIKFFGLFLLTSLLFFSCAKKDTYDYNGIKPKLIGGIKGASETFASGLAPITFSVAGRGGSTFDWSVTGWGATIEKNDAEYEAYITFDQSVTDTAATVTVTETTQGGIKSEPVTQHLKLYKFKPMAFESFLGTWTGVETDGDGITYDVTLNFVAGPEENQIKLEAVDGLPALMKDLYVGWGETFQAGHGNDGDIYLNLDLLTGGITLDCEYFGQTLPGPWDYFFSGSGTWEGFTPSISLSYGLQFDNTCSDNYNSSTIVLTKE